MVMVNLSVDESEGGESLVGVRAELQTTLYSMLVQLRNPLPNIGHKRDVSETAHTCNYRDNERWHD